MVPCQCQPPPILYQPSLSHVHSSTSTLGPYQCLCGEGHHQISTSSTFYSRSSFQLRAQIFLTVAHNSSIHSVLTTRIHYHVSVSASTCPKSVATIKILSIPNTNKPNYDHTHSTTHVNKDPKSSYNIAHHNEWWPTLSSHYLPFL